MKLSFDQLNTHKNISATNPVLLGLDPKPLWVLLSVGLSWSSWKPVSGRLCFVQACDQAPKGKYAGWGLPASDEYWGPFSSHPLPRGGCRTVHCLGQGSAIWSLLLLDWQKGGQDPTGCYQAQPVIAQKWLVNLELCASLAKNIKRF